MLKGSIKASIEDSVETLQSDSLKEPRRWNDDDEDEDPKVRHGKGCGERKEGEREFAVTKERKPRPSLGMRARERVHVSARPRASIFDGGEERTSEI